VRGQRFEEPRLKRLAEKHGKTPAQVLLRWSLQKVWCSLEILSNVEEGTGTAGSVLTVIAGICAIAKVHHKTEDRGECGYI